jgi:predicted transcriptional regulator
MPTKKIPSNEARSRPQLPSIENPRGVVTDLDILTVLATVDSGPVFAAELGEALGLEETRIATRLSSLVSLGYLEQLLAGKDGGYTITARGRDALSAAGVRPVQRLPYAV